jgi:hypothetical protein
MFKILVFLLCFFFALPVHATCTFKTGEYIDELSKPQNITHINIEVAKSGKYARNLLKVLASKSTNIPPNLKKKFKAKFTVTYPFGSCEFNGRIRQNGDWKDHIALIEGGNPVRSLDVKLSDGNILQAVSFKLLIPETRRSENEILATQLLKKLNFISPETFAVDVSVNGISSTMLFQENAEKELLERNLRRESAIFEGDEELLWSYEDYSLFQLEPVALGRLSNANWFAKGSSSAKISLSAFSKIQRSYLDYAANTDDYLGLVIDPNENDKIFDEMAFSLLVMNAAHAMRPHNRKYYFNTLKNMFEPIYYDGNASFIHEPSEQMGRELDTLINVQFPNGIDSQFISKFENVLKSKRLKSDFLARSQRLKIDNLSFYEAAIQQVMTNVGIMTEKIKYGAQTHITNNQKGLVASYRERMAELDLEQLVFENLKMTEQGYQGITANGSTVSLSNSDVAKLISKNRYKDKRAILLEVSNAELWEEIRKIPENELMANIYTSGGITYKILDETKTIHFSQTDPTDWVLISGGNLADWSIKFDGKIIDEETELDSDQRFNTIGITGCLTFLETNLDNTAVNVSNGGCEDSLNIISSKGSIESLKINRAFADALDMDFSNVTIKDAFIQNAGNDCYDVSTGTYRIINGKFEMCGDKGISVGEGSKLRAENLKVVNSNIGISSKDYSTVMSNSATFVNVTTCIEAKQKKQEFGGAFAVVNKMDCDGLFSIDQHSIVKVAENEL